MKSLTILRNRLIVIRKNKIRIFVGEKMVGEVYNFDLGAYTNHVAKAVTLPNLDENE